MSNEAGAENATDAVASALMDLAAEVAGLDDCRPVRDRALKGGSEFHIPPQLSELDSCQAAVNALAADERLAILVDEGTPDRPIVRVGPYGVRLRVSTLPLGMIASAIVQCCLREPYAGWPAPAVPGGRDRGNLDVLRRIAERKTVVLTCVAGVRGTMLQVRGHDQVMEPYKLGWLPVLACGQRSQTTTCSSSRPPRWKRSAWTLSKPRHAACPSSTSRSQG